MNDQLPYGYVVEYERTRPGCGILPQYETATLRRAGTESAAKRAASLKAGFTRILSCTPIPLSEAPAPRKRSNAIVRAQPSPALSHSDVDATADAVQVVRQAAAELADMAKRRRELVASIESHIDTINRFFPSPDGKTNHIRERCARLRELFNMEELESWQITINAVMTATWQRLP